MLTDRSDSHTGAPSPQPATPGDHSADKVIIPTREDLLDQIRTNLEDCYHYEDMPNVRSAFELIRGAYWRIRDLVQQLMDRCPYPGHLPHGGQALWRRFRSAVFTLDARDDTPFFCVLDGFLGWIAGLDPNSFLPAPDQAPAPGGRPGAAAGGRRSDRPVRQRTSGAKAWREREIQTLRRALVIYHSTSDRRDTPLTQRELATLLGWSTSRVQRRAKDAFPGGWAGYLAEFGTGRRPGFLPAGGQPDGIVDPPED